MPLTSGSRIGPYEILGALGAGGMGELYRGNDTRLNRPVAINVLPAAVADDPERRQRFEREAKAIAALNHPHICTRYNVATHDGALCLVIELLEGETLAPRLARAPSPPISGTFLRRPPVSPRKDRSSARITRWRRSRSKAPTPTRAATSSRSARCSTK